MKLPPPHCHGHLAWRMAEPKAKAGGPKTQQNENENEEENKNEDNNSDPDANQDDLKLEESEIMLDEEEQEILKELKK